MNQFRPEAWLPTTKKEVEMRGWDYIDVILFNGDAYVDHPSFGGAVIGRTLEAEGLRVAIVPKALSRFSYRQYWDNPGASRVCGPAYKRHHSEGVCLPYNDLSLNPSLRLKHRRKAEGHLTS